jgi:hypothetical protein
LGGRTCRWSRRVLHNNQRGQKKDSEDIFHLLS